jgi:uncharacterized protein (DUF2236 family)
MNDATQMRMPTYRVIAAEPGPADFCLVLFADGRRVSVYSVADYHKAFKEAFQVAEQRQCQMKLLPMTAAELNAFLNICPENLVQNTTGDPAMRQLVVSACKETLIKSNDQSARANALELLVQLRLVA